MSFGTTAEWFGAEFFFNWYLDSLSISHFTTSASITEYWQEMMSVLIDFLDVILLRIHLCPHQYDFSNYIGVAWWYNHLQLVSGQLEYITLHYKYFHH